MKVYRFQQYNMIYIFIYDRVKVESTIDLILTYSIHET